VSTACATCWPSCPTGSANACGWPTGRRSTTPPTSATAKHRLQALVDQLDNAGYTAAAKCLADDLDALVVHLRYPTRHRRSWRSTNLLQRSLAEVKRRTKVIGRFPGETSCLTLVWAVLDLYITHATNGVRFTQLERQRLRRIRHAGSEPTTDEE
jgi:putative transposase